MKRSRLLLLLLSTLALSLTGISSASAAPPAPAPAPQIDSVAPLASVHGGVVSVAGLYRCWGDASTMHLWVSIKQGGPDPTAEGSSSTVSSWYDTNVSQDVEVTCNGRWQLQRVDLGRNDTDFGGRALSSIRNGGAWVQFCLVPAAADEDPTLLASSSRWVFVLGAF